MKLRPSTDGGKRLGRRVSSQTIAVSSKGRRQVTSVADGKLGVCTMNPTALRSLERQMVVSMTEGLRSQMKVPRVFETIAVSMVKVGIGIGSALQKEVTSTVMRRWLWRRLKVVLARSKLLRKEAKMLNIEPY